MFALEGLGFLDTGDFGFCELRRPGLHHLKMNTAPCWEDAALPREELRLRVKNHHSINRQINFDSFTFYQLLA